VFAWSQDARSCVITVVGTFFERRADDELLRAARDGDAAAFACFYVRHREVVLAYCGRRARAPEAAADLMAETFAAALVAVHDRRRALPDVPLAWLFTIAHRKALDAYRRGRVEDAARRRIAAEPLVLDDADLQRIVDVTGRVDVASELARQLPPDQFEALRARVLDERGYPEIAAQTKSSEPVIRKRVSRALHSLRAAIGDHP
jgi:RNA polymerase sigma factor (sigma-70 family)